MEVRLFRLNFESASPRSSCRIHVTADSRYRLWLNGEPLGFGPAKGTLARYYFDSYELRDRLRPGRNVLAAEVRHFGQNCPVSQVQSPVPGFMVQGETGETKSDWDTPGKWKVWVHRGLTPDTTPRIDNAHVFLDHLDHLDTREEPVDWRELSFDDSAWSSAISTGPAAALGQKWGVAPLRRLVPRDVAPLLEETHRFIRAIQSKTEVPLLFAEPPTGWMIAAGEGATMLLDAGNYTTGFPVIEFIGGTAREVRVMYAEALGEWRDVNGARVWSKSGVRDDYTRQEPHGYWDTIILRGDRYRWEPFYWRAFRYLQIEVLAGPAALAVSDVVYRLCVHPQEFRARFRASDPDAERIFAVSVRTLRVGAHEIYDDSPYFEQVSYIADSRIEALGSLYLCNETDLPRRNLRLFRDTLRADGLLDARAPCQYSRQTIPYFCLHWIFMVEDYWLWVGRTDQAFVQECLAAADTILNFFRSRLRDDGFVGVTGGWNMVDSVAEWPHGEPPAVRSGGSTYLSCLFVEALQVGARLHRDVGVAEDGLRWTRLARRLSSLIRRTAWDAKHGLFREGTDPVGWRCSHHVQAGAINSGVANGIQARRILQRMWADPALIRSHSMQSFYVARALERTTSFDNWHEHLITPWREGLAKGLTTWPEYPDPCRSDSHAWAAWPAVDYIRTVLGIRPAAAGWDGITLAPQTGGLEWAEGEAPTPLGLIKVSWRKVGKRLQFAARVPTSQRTVVVVPGAAPRDFKSGGVIEFEVPLPAQTNAATRLNATS